MNTRPHLIVPATRTDLLIEMLAAGALVLFIGLAVFGWTRLPDVIPSHFDLHGNLDHYGSRNTVLYLIPVVIGLYTLLTVVACFPRTFNYVVEITEKNASAQYQLAKTFMRIMKLEVLLVFAVVEFSMINSALDHRLNAVTLMIGLPVVIAAMIGTMACYMSRSLRAA